MWNNQRLFSILMLVVGAVGVYGALKVPLAERFTLGPGAAPLIYATAVILCSLGLLYSSSDKKDGSIRSILNPPGKPGFLFFICNLGLAAASYWIGFIAALFLFSLLSLVLVCNWKAKSALVFSIAWTAFLYAGFNLLLRVNFLEGYFFSR